MLEQYQKHNLARLSLQQFLEGDPQLASLNKLKYQFQDLWWHDLVVTEPGLYILTGGRQVGKSTSCKLLMAHCLKEKLLKPSALFYLPCDEIYDAKEFSRTLRLILSTELTDPFLLIIDEVTYVKDWDRVIKALADEGVFERGLCLLTGSDSVILKEAAQRFPGRRGKANQTDFHMHPLCFPEYVNLVTQTTHANPEELAALFKTYIQTGGYLKAINDFATQGALSESTFQTYEQWIRGDFLKQGKSEETLLAVLRELIIIGVSPISYTKLAQKIGVISKETCIDYLRLLGRMDILLTLQAYDQNKKTGFPRKDRKFHFADPFIFRTIIHWLHREGYLSENITESYLVEATVASHCARVGKVYYFKGQGEVDVIAINNNEINAFEVKWAEQIRANDLKTLKQFHRASILTKHHHSGQVEGINSLPVYQFLMDTGNYAVTAA
jgi:predicted AAA+ superfamily ATPase